MSYAEVLNSQYALLLIMQNDKIRQKIKKDKTTTISGKEMLKRKREINV